MVQPFAGSTLLLVPFLLAAGVVGRGEDPAATTAEATKSRATRLPSTSSQPASSPAIDRQADRLYPESFPQNDAQPGSGVLISGSDPQSPSSGAPWPPRLMPEPGYSVSRAWGHETIEPRWSIARVAGDSDQFDDSLASIFNRDHARQGPGLGVVQHSPPRPGDATAWTAVRQAEPLPIPSGSAETSLLLPESPEIPAAGQPGASQLPAPANAAEPLFSEIIQDALAHDSEEAIEAGAAAFFREREFIYRPPGLGVERVMHAPFQVDTTQPLNNISLGTDLAYNFLWPNRAEYFMAGPPVGPAVEDSLDYQDFLLKFELGTKNFSLATEIPIRGVAPEINRNHAGLGDINLTLKTVFLDGKRWQITPIFRTYVNTGNAKLGLGTGSVSLEPGVLFRYRVNDSNYIHAALQYWFPVGGNPIHGGQVLSDGFAWTRVLRESDTYAIMSSLEAVHWQLMDGQRTTSAGVFDIDGENVFTAYAGIRLARDTASDLGLVEYGLQWGTAFGEARWYQNLIRFDLRFSF